MAADLTGQRIAFVATDGFEQVELTEPWKALANAGADVELLAPEPGEILGLNHIDKGETFPVDKPVSEADSSEYAGLVLPGGVVNADALRINGPAREFVRAFFEQGKPVAVICHGPWILADIDVLRGRTLTSWPTLETDLRNAGAVWVDAEVHVDGRLVSSRKPADLPAFCAAVVDQFHQGRQHAAA